jgi:hypothetical protein
VSYGHDISLKPLLRDREVILFERGDVAADCFLDVGDGFFLRGALADASWKAWALDHPVTVFARIQEDLSHLTPPLSQDSILERPERDARGPLRRHPFIATASSALADEMVAQLTAQRRRWRFSYYIVFESVVEAFAPVVERLAGVD